MKSFCTQQKCVAALGKMIFFFHLELFLFTSTFYVLMYQSAGIGQKGKIISCE